MEYKENGLPKKNFAISIRTKDDSREVGKIFSEHYSDAMNITSPGYDGMLDDQVKTFHYYINDSYCVGCNNNPKMENTYTLEEFKALLKGKDHIVNNYPIY